MGVCVCGSLPACACALTSVMAMRCLFTRGQSSASSADDQQIIGVCAVERFLTDRDSGGSRRSGRSRAHRQLLEGSGRRTCAAPSSTVSSSAHHRGPAAADAGSDDGSALEASQRAEGGWLSSAQRLAGWLPLTSGYLDFLAPNAAMANDERNERGN